MDALLRLLMGPWTTYILWLLSQHGTMRFSALKRQVPGISAKVLTERVRRLERAGVVHRAYRPTIPPQVSYALSPRGQELRQVLEGLEGIARRWQAEDNAPQGATQCPSGKTELSPVQGCTGIFDD